MPVLRYDIGVYVSSTKTGFSMPVYVQVSDKCHQDGDDPFSEDVNGCGPSGELEQILAKKLYTLERKMAKAIDVSEDRFRDMLEYSFPMELYSNDPVEKEPDYVYEWDREYVLSDEELLSKWNDIKERLGVQTLNMKNHYNTRCLCLFPNALDTLNKFYDGKFRYEDFDVLVPLFSDILNLSDANEDQKMYALEVLQENLHLLV